MMQTVKLQSILQALLAALLFGVSAPLSKLLLGDVPPILMAAFLYLGSGMGLTLIRVAQTLRNPSKREASLTRKDIPWLAGAILAGGVAAPIALMISLKNTPASTASLLFNFEGVATTLIAALAFREAIGRRAWGAILIITLASILLSTDFGGNWGMSLSALGIVLACVLWGVDNNFTRNISDKDPLIIVAWKGLLAGAFSLGLGLMLGEKIPPLLTVFAIMLMGLCCYGLSTMLCVISMRGLGAARTSALFGTAPLVGVVLSLVILRETPSWLMGLATLLTMAGAWLLIDEKHSHHHIHEALIHEHRHEHNDPNHAHHDIALGPHAERHEHPAEEHEHDHSPDIHHRHGHDQS